MDGSGLSFLAGEADRTHSDTFVAPSDSATQLPLNGEELSGIYRAMQEERSKRQDLEQKLSELNQSPPTAPSEQDLGLTVYANNLRVSRRFAEREYGREAIAALHDWAAAKCDTDPDFNRRMRLSDDPYEAAKKAFDEQDRTVADPIFSRSDSPCISDQLPPRSLANAPGNGAVGRSHVPVGEGNAYGSLFK